MGKFDYVLDICNARTPQETHAALKRCGILEEDGQLADHRTEKQKQEKRSRRRKTMLHSTPDDMHYVEKTWGYERWIWNEEYCGKILFFRKDCRCSWHYHLKKDEVLYLQRGSVLVKYSEGDDISKAEEVTLQPGDSFHVPVGLRHQMVALKRSYITEFSTHHEDEDSIRINAGG